MKNFFGGHLSKNEYGQSGHGILKLNVSQKKKKTDEIKLFFSSCYEFSKAKS